MTIDLSKDLEQIVHEALLSGHYAGEQDVIRDALTRLKRSIPASAKGSVRKTTTKQSAAKQMPLSPDELNQHLLAAGLILTLPDSAEDVDDDDMPPVEILGEPLSETIIRERR